MSVIAPSTPASAGAPSRLTNPAIPHIYQRSLPEPPCVREAAVIAHQAASGCFGAIDRTKQIDICSFHAYKIHMKKPTEEHPASTRTPLAAVGAQAIGAQAIGAQAIKAQSIGGLAIG